MTAAAPALAVLCVSDSFADVWRVVASSLDLDLRVGASPAELRLTDGVVAVVVGAGGREDLADAAIGELRSVTSAPLAVVGATGDYRLAVSMVRAGADEYFALPGDLSELRAWTREQLENVERLSEEARLLHVHRQQYDFSQLVGTSPALRDTLSQAAALIPTRKTVLVRGETGTGKELLARAIHFNGPRGAQPFLEVNCTTLTETLMEAELFGYERGAFTDARSAKPGLFEAADGGTLFLDEIGDLSPALQVKLLKVIEDKRIRRLGSVTTRQVDVRVIAATHVDLEAAVRQGRFREDLYYRLSIVPLELPPLRERGKDVLLLARHFLRRESEENGIPCPALAPETERAMLKYPWPGNVRELRNSIERAVILYGAAGTLLPEHLLRNPPGALRPPREGDGPLPFPATLEEIERAAAVAAVEYTEGNKSRAAMLLGIGRRRLYTLLGEGS